MPIIRALLFDLDNTLIDFMKMKQAAVDAAILAMLDAGLTMTASEASRSIWEIYDRDGIESQEVFDRFLLENLGKIDYKILASGIIAYRRAREASMVLYPHVKSTLIEMVRRGYRLAILSDAPSKQAWLRLCALGLQHFFETVIAFEDTGQRKPHPLPFRLALDTLGVLPQEAVMIGDWPERDMAGAKAVGIRTIFARYGNVKGDFHVKCDREIDDISELLEILGDPVFNH
ncbi:MAG: TIGR02253 family HAD-type hydrolase [bacterium]|nr:TIGR02253 family HAD-type hydrolase [bacterium]